MLSTQQSVPLQIVWIERCTKEKKNKSVCCKGIFVLIIFLHNPKQKSKYVILIFFAGSHKLFPLFSHKISEVFFFWCVGSIKHFFSHFSPFPNNIELHSVSLLSHPRLSLWNHAKQTANEMPIWPHQVRKMTKVQILSVFWSA